MSRETELFRVALRYRVFGRVVLRPEIGPDRKRLSPYFAAVAVPSLTDVIDLGNPWQSFWPARILKGIEPDKPAARGRAIHFN